MLPNPCHDFTGTNAAKLMLRIAKSDPWAGERIPNIAGFGESFCGDVCFHGNINNPALSYWQALFSIFLLFLFTTSFAPNGLPPFFPLSRELAAFFSLRIPPRRIAANCAGVLSVGSVFMVVCPQI